MVDYEVIWTGVNDGHDGDLLCGGDRIPTKRQNVKLNEPRACHRCMIQKAELANQRILEALPVIEVQALTCTEISNLVHLGKRRVNSAFAVLRERGQLAVSVTRKSGFRARPANRYWRVSV